MSDQNIGAGDAKVRLESALQQLMLLALSGKPYLPVKNGIGSPAGWFLFERMTSPHPGDQDIRRDIRKANACSGLYGDSVERERRFVGEKYKRALLDLLASDIPLTQDERQHIAESLAPTDPARSHQQDARRFDKVAGTYIKFLRKHKFGSITEAERAFAASLGVSVEALRKRRQRVRGSVGKKLR